MAALEGEVLAGFVARAIGALGALQPTDAQVERVLDLGSGPGVGTCALAEAFPNATVTAVDNSPAMLALAAERADRLGARVVTRQIDLSADLSTLGEFDVVFASMSLHHVGDEAAALSSFRHVVSIGGLIVIVEQAGPVHIEFADGDHSWSTVWAEIDAAWLQWFTEMRAGLPGSAPSRDYGEMLEAAGFDVLVDRVMAVSVSISDNPAARDFGRVQLQRSMDRLGVQSSATTRAALEAVLASATPVAESGTGADAWSDAEVSATRRLLVGRARQIG